MRGKGLTGSSAITRNKTRKSKTLTRMDLSEAVFREVGLSRNESAQLVESVVEHVSSALAKGEQVKISSFGTFSVRDKAARGGRNPKTQEDVQVSPRKTLTFKPSPASRPSQRGSRNS
ncbi:integration host factor subunit alpha [Roseibium polysiphoniae]|uniref:integration host factor subunit alpha n=1 Tax=Roseibium polysiphoniae TaxID=2571221 RepID=UPI003297E9F0